MSGRLGLRAVAFFASAWYIALSESFPRNRASTVEARRRLALQRHLRETRSIATVVDSRFRANHQRFERGPFPNDSDGGIPGNSARGPGEL